MSDNLSRKVQLTQCEPIRSTQHTLQAHAPVVPQPHTLQAAHADSLPRIPERLRKEAGGSADAQVLARRLVHQGAGRAGGVYQDHVLAVGGAGGEEGRGDSCFRFDALLDAHA